MADGAKPDRKTEPGSLLSQWWTVLRVQYDERTKPRHVSVMMIIVQAFRRDFGNGRASISYIRRATRLNDRTVVKTCRELADWGFVMRDVVSGRTTEYVPSWATAKPYPASVVLGAGENTSGDFATVKNAGGTSVIFAGGSCPTSCTFDSESYLLSPAYKPADSKSTNAVSASGPDAEAPAVAGIGFERIWKAYGRYGNKQASKQAFEAITNPEMDHIVSRATAWAASAKPGRRRMPLEKWLAAEKYDEADRSVRPKAEAEQPELAEEDDMGRRRSSSVDAAEAAEHDRKLSGAAIEINVPRGVPLTVVSSAVEKRGGDTWMAVQTDRGRVAVLCEGGNAPLQDAGQEHLRRLAYACDVTIDDPAVLLGKSFMIARGTFAALPDREAA